jgi:hypothetical protein
VAAQCSSAITLPLRNKDALTLPEPSIAQLAEMTTYVLEADDSLPDPPAMPEDGADLATIAAATEVLRERTVKTFSAEAPYGLALVKLVKLAVDVDVTLDDLPSWAASPVTCRSILGHWQTPLAGGD